MNDLILFSELSAFRAGTLDNLKEDASIGRGALILPQDVSEGIFTSPEMPVKAFSTVVLSWNTDLPEGCSSEAQCRVRDENGEWSKWLSWGLWSPYLRRASLPETDGGCASVETDTLTMHKNHIGEALQLRCILRRESGSGIPALRLLAASSRLSPEDRFTSLTEPSHVDNPAPAYTQVLRDPNIGSVMCSPTTATVLMNARGGDLLPEETAMACWDYEYQGFGNWAFTMAAAGSFGYECWLTYADADDLRRELLSGYPVGCNVAYAPTPERATPRVHYMENTPGYTAGHLMCVTGMTVEDGREWLLVHDSYGCPDSLAIRRYPMEQFLQCWHGILYVLRPRLAGAGYAAPHRVPVQLKKTDSGDEWMVEMDGQFRLLSPDFCGTRKQPGGVVAYTLRDAYLYATTANRPFCYSKVTANGALLLPAKQLLRSSPLGNDARMDIFVITNHGITYTASLTPADL